MKNLYIVCYNEIHNWKVGVDMADLCYGCMKDTHGEQICPHCGFSKDTVQESPFLPFGTSLENGRYTVGKVLDNRPDSVRYIGYDNKIDKIVAIREFLPLDLFRRSENSSVVTVNKGKDKSFASLKQQFITLGNKLKDIDDVDCIVKVENVFQDNHTAYIVEEYEEVITFGEYVQRSGEKLEWEATRNLIKPLLDGLILLSEKSINHFAICPANLVVTADGKLKLTGFAIKTIRQKGKKLEAQLFSGCSAPEQYDAEGVLDTATDIYGFCATLFFALTGKLPNDAIKRKENSRLLMSASVVKKLPPFVVQTIAKGLNLERDERISSFSKLSEQLSATTAVKKMQDEISKTVEVPKEETTKKRKISNFQIGVITMVIGLIVFGGIGYAWYSTYPLDGVFDIKSGATGATSSSEVMGQDSTYATDSEYFRVPDFIGKTWEEANAISAESTEYSIFKAIDEEFSDTVPQGQICRQTPDAKKTVNRGTDGVSITCVISKGAQYRELPKVENTTKDEATDKLVKDGFVVESTLSYSDTVKAGSVIGYSGNLKEGDKREFGSQVVLSVSLGKKPESATEQSFNFSDPTSTPVTPNT